MTYNKSLNSLDIKTNNFIKEFTKKYIETESFYERLTKSSDSIFNIQKWEVCASTATTKNESDHIIPSHDYIKMMIDSIKPKKAEQEVTHAVPEDKEFIFDPKELDI